MFAAVVQWWRRRRDAAHVDPTAYDRPPGLMVRRMARLGLDSQELRAAEPEQFHRLRANCLGCPCPEVCALALLDESMDLAWQEWRDYCPNATELSMLSAVSHCCANRDAGRAERTR
jgi:hypothetical protein